MSAPEHVIFASYGNDSIALIQWAAERGLPGVHVAYSDTGWAAPFWPERVAAAERWAAGNGFTHHRIVSEGMAALVRRKKAWPRGGGGKYQFCTEALKESPALAWLERVDPDGGAVCMVGIRREESANRAQFPEHVEASERHGGRSLWAPLVRHAEAERNELISRTPFPVLPLRSKECHPCVNARKPELRHLDEATIVRIAELERELGTNSKGNARVMFSPKRHGGAVGIEAVVDDAKRNMTELFSAHLCDGGWCE